MQWWISRPATSMCIDNAVVNDISLAGVPGNVTLIYWREDRGEIEYDDRPPLRDLFYDVTPYVAFFQQFMTGLSGVTLAQAQKIQTDLVAQLFETKRQAPYHYAVAAGSYDWLATDAEVTAMTAAFVAGVPGGSSGLSTQINALVVSINNNIVSPGNVSLINQINANIVSTGNVSLVNQINSDFTALVGYLNNTVLGTFDAAENKINYRLTGSPMIGLDPPGIPHTSSTAIVGPFGAIAGPFGAVSAGSGSPMQIIQWLPSGGSALVNVTGSEMSAILAGITARRQSLLTTKTTKAAAINALTTVAAVIAYDVTVGWPA